MPQFGSYCLSLAWLLALYGVVIGYFGGSKKRYDLFLSSRISTVLVCLTSFLAIFALGYSFLHDDYTLQYVWQFSNREMQPIYKISAIWGGMDGSMLLWCAMLSVGSAIVAYRSKEHPWQTMSYVISVLNTSLLFFLTVVLFLTNPFRYIKADFIPADGNGLNPLLQNPLMVIHPPTLYLGFTTFAIPYAFCLGWLLAGNINNDWIRITRRWTLIAWAFLTAGIVMGGHWAYVELGWGGFWAWDPVENASFLPWLSGTAFVHSVMVQERKGMLKTWNVGLIVLTYGLTVFGTFLTRSGVVQSVHSFADTDVGWVFLVYLGLLATATCALCFVRRQALRSDKKIEHFFSREAAFLVNNLVFLSVLFATLWGVMFPVLSEALTGVKQTVSIPFFDAVNVPLFLLLIFLMGVGPLIAWRQASIESLRKTFLVPFVFSLAIAVLLTFVGIQSFYPILSYSLCFFVLLTILGEIHRGLRAQQAGSNKLNNLPRLLKRHRVRYAGYLIHLGVTVAAIGITASMAHKVEREFSLKPGESYDLGKFRLKLVSIDEAQQSNYSSLTAKLDLLSVKDGKLLRTMKPELRSYVRNQENTTEVALRQTFLEDVYIVMIGLDDSGTRAALKVFINPLQMWLWLGTVIMVIGTVIAILPERAKELSPAGIAAAIQERS